VEYEGRTLMLVGDSGTQCVLQNANLNYRAWIDDCAERGIPMIHVWSFMAPRQKSDGSELEERWKYVYPGLTPWRRHSGGQPAHDQLPRWNLQLFDDGADGALDHYWPRARDLCAYARSKKILVGYTVFTGWIKGNANAWAYHPFNKVNGGHLDRNLPDGVTIATPGQEIWNKDWQEDWSTAEKTQWIWERFALKAIEELNPFGNVFFVFFDEHSYTEGNMGDHFLQFFKKRNALWMDWAPRRQQVDFVLNDTNDRPDKNSLSVAGFFQNLLALISFWKEVPIGVRTFAQVCGLLPWAADITVIMAIQNRKHRKQVLSATIRWCPAETKVWNDGTGSDI